MPDSDSRTDDAFLTAVVDRLLPADETPSGSQAGVVDFLHRVLSRDLAHLAGAVAAGLAALQAAGFAEADPAGQDALLAAPEHGAFVALLSGLVAQGFYGDPAVARAASWSSIGYRQEPPGGGWPANTDPPVVTTPHGAVRDAYDVVVVGSGAGGGVAAAVLAEAGLQVLVVERGPWLDTDALPLDHLRAERAPWGYERPTNPRPSGHPRVVETAEGEVVVDPTDARWSANATTLGGGMRVYGAQAWRFSPEDFRMATTYGVPEGSSLADWPIGYDDLEPFYDQAEWELGVAGDPAGDSAAGPRARGLPLPPFELNAGGQRLASGAAALGLRTSPVPLLVNSVDHGGRPACARCGACIGFSCPSGSKTGTHNTVLPRAVASGNGQLLVDAQVTRLTTDADGRVDGVVVAGESPTMWRREIKATAVVVAAGAIESARLLLNSRSVREPAGLGNNHDQVGRNLQAHVYAGAVGFFADATQDCVGPGPTIATNDFRHGNDGIVGGAMLANDFVPTPVLAWETLTRLGVVAPYGLAGKQGMRDRYPRMQLVFGPVQEVPNPDARVTVDEAVHDAFGVPVARLSGDIHPEDRVTARFVAERAREWLEASGAGEVVTVTADERPKGPSGGQHQAGTLRMGSDPVSSVTDSWGLVWGHDNLLVADGSVHVTNGGVNPVLTILALAYRNAAHLAEQLRP